MDLTERIRNHTFFEQFRPEHLDLLIRGAREVEFNPGELIFHEGEPAAEFYLIEKGKIAVEAHDRGDGTETIQELGEGEAFGWSWLFPPYAWHFQTRALEATTSIALSGAHLLTCAEDDHEFGYELMKRMTQVLMHRLQATRHRLMEKQRETIMEG